MFWIFVHTHKGMDLFRILTVKYTWTWYISFIVSVFFSQCIFAVLVIFSHCSLCRQMVILFSHNWLLHYSDVIMSTMASQVTSLTIVYTTVYSGADQRKHQSSASLAFVRGIHWWLVNSPHKWPVTRKNVSIWWRHHENLHLTSCHPFVREGYFKVNSQIMFSIKNKKERGHTVQWCSTVKIRVLSQCKYLFSRYTDFHYNDKMIMTISYLVTRPCYLYNEILYTGKRVLLSKKCPHISPWLYCEYFRWSWPCCDETWVYWIWEKPMSAFSTWYQPKVER